MLATSQIAHRRNVCIGEMLLDEGTKMDWSLQASAHTLATARPGQAQAQAIVHLSPSEETDSAVAVALLRTRLSRHAMALLAVQWHGRMLVSTPQTVHVGVKAFEACGSAARRTFRRTPSPCRTRRSSAMRGGMRC